MRPFINPQMVMLARQVRALTQTELANLMGVSQGTVSRIELGVAPLNQDVLSMLSRALQFPEEFFTQTHRLSVPDMKYHRARKSVPKKLLDRQDAMINIVQMHVARLLRSAELTFDGIRCFDPEAYSTPEEWARAVRQFWKIPAGPVENITNAIENAGGIVVHCDFGSSRLDGVSVTGDKLPPIIFVNKELLGDRLRFTLAHELGHALMHSHRPPTGEEEEEANRFASELLMPADAIRHQLTHLTMERLGILKRHWRVSMSALVRRAKDLGMITDNQYRYLNTRMSAAGWRKREPQELDIPTETPLLMRELLDLHRDLGYTFNDLAAALCITPADLVEWYKVRPPNVIPLVQPATAASNVLRLDSRQSNL
jgi:Zn-dependent peptidase ImmA (M78 family)/DNA-binding XRE family transcriptional regulator